MRIKISANILPNREIIDRLGLSQKGNVQQFLTDRVLFRMRRYMPWRTGHTAESLTIASSPTSITVNAPYAQYLYNGVSKGGHPLNYTKTENPLAGPFWDRTLIQEEGKAIAQEVNDYARSIS